MFDGYVLSWRLHIDRPSTGSIRIWAQDASWLMNIDDMVREWPGVTDGQVAQSIFLKYGFTPSPACTDDDSPAHLPAQHTLFQRATDLEFLYGLARRNGKICRVTCGEKPGERTGYFIRPSASGAPVATITLTGSKTWTVDGLDLEWDVMRPTTVRASQASSASEPSTATATATASGLPALGARNLRSYAGRSSSMRADRDRRRAGAAAAHGRGADRIGLVRPLRGRGRSRPARHRAAGRDARPDRRRGQGALGKLACLASQPSRRP